MAYGPIEQSSIVCVLYHWVLLVSGRGNPGHRNRPVIDACSCELIYGVSRES